MGTGTGTDGNGGALGRDGFEILCGVELPGLESVAKVLEAPSFSRTRAGARHLLRHAGVSALAHQPALLEIACRAVGTGAVPFRATLFDKSPNANWLVSWHQDTALPLRSRHDRPGWGSWSEKEGVLYAHAPASALERIVAIRIHLDDSSSENGPLRVLPGTHRLGVLSDDALARWAAKVRAVECTVSRGGLVMMKPLIVHASSKAATDRRRRVLHLEYAGSLALDGAELAPS
jgi:hypothetical protein